MIDNFYNSLCKLYFETANYYVSSAGAAHVCMLDASKA